MFRQGQRSSDRLFTILYTVNGLDEPRLGFAISKRNVRNAVQRNRLRRLVRESFRNRLAEFRALDVVVMARPAAATAGNPDVFASLVRHWAKLGKNAVTDGTRPDIRDR